MENTIDKIKDIIGVEEYNKFIENKDNIVYIKMMGACANCEMLDVTLKEGIEASIKSEIPEVKEIINVE